MVCKSIVKITEVFVCVRIVLHYFKMNIELSEVIPCLVRNGAKDTKAKV
jgi:hypothetical protein